MGDLRTKLAITLAVRVEWKSTQFYCVINAMPENYNLCLNNCFFVENITIVLYKAVRSVIAHSVDLQQSLAVVRGTTKSAIIIPFFSNGLYPKLSLF